MLSMKAFERVEDLRKGLCNANHYSGFLHDPEEVAGYIVKREMARDEAWARYVAAVVALRDAGHALGANCADAETWSKEAIEERGKAEDVLSNLGVDETLFYR